MLDQGIHTLPERPLRATRRYRNTGTTRPAFTLLEILVVGAIIVVLATLLLPVFAMMRSNCARVVCSSRLRDLVIASQTYARSNDDRFPLPASDGLSAPVPNLLPVRLLNDLHPYAGYPAVEPGTAAAALPPAVQCPLLEDAGAERGPYQESKAPWASYYTGYVYLGGLGPAAGPVGAPGLSVPSRWPPLRAPSPAGPGLRAVTAKGPTAPTAAMPRTIPNSAPTAGAPGLPGAAAPVGGVTLKAGSAAAKLGDGGALWADDVSLSAAGGTHWRFAHARSGAEAGSEALSYANPSACLGQHRGYADASVRWVPVDELRLENRESAEAEIMRADAPAAAAGPAAPAAPPAPVEPAASYKVGANYWWF